MVRLEREDTNFIFEIVGWHKLLTFTNRLIIPMSHIVNAYPNEQPLGFIPGLRLMGTGFPGLISAGTYILPDGIIFCDVVNHENSIAVELRNEYYKMLLIEVEEPLEAIHFLNQR
ncbi:hypothetical protein Aeqsu_0700 [Aequorivita sublithincola DSM 14238]|uniref:Uncharacterized protein n=1 Tax=Aequorivita sublithincola (strain DSM 14238 / LMG 21431 / ACAM 643 / 9-3) TaxID=746697 RepID=I3YT90_AEQSU|nr:hypothetical protein [Aequorivita sublithincola]AFL80208.1 hypothetical protein Aeqsu_0700 [Aequorivita sublithincola DSM 14238]